MFKITGCIYPNGIVHLFFRKILVYLTDSYTKCLRKVKKRIPSVFFTFARNIPKLVSRLFSMKN